MVDKKFIGGVLLVVGTSIGGAMLALPVAIAKGGFVNGSLMLLAAWLVMTIGSFYLLEANLWLPEDSNLVSMSRATLGRTWQIVTWLAYLALLYSLISAYISGGSEVIHNFTHRLNLNVPFWLDELIFVALLGSIVYQGIRAVDYVNRGLMFVKLASFSLLIVLLFPHVQSANLKHHSFHYAFSNLTILITSFGFATIVPSLRVYFRSDPVIMRKLIIIGSIIPLVCYILWIAVTLGVVPLAGDAGMINVVSASDQNTALTNAIEIYINNKWISEFWQFFITVSIGTSFLGVSLCLFDFLADGFQVAKKGKAKWGIFVLTFVPPLLIVLFYPDAFHQALSYAGVFCVLLLVMLPVLMVWHGRYQKQIASGYQVWGGKPLLVFAFVVSGLLIVLSHFV